MTMYMDLTKKIEAVAEVKTPQHVLDIMESSLRSLGASHVLITQMPMPNRSIEHMILRLRWPDIANGGAELNTVSADDAILMLGLAADRATVRPVSHALSENSPLLKATDQNADVLVIPVLDLAPVQIMIFACGPNLSVNRFDLNSLEILASTAVMRLKEMGEISGQRPGALSVRERKVLELTAYGKTANEIAEVLDISQRTVHAHLQNSSNKLNASNKTHTVIEALRYGQIQL